MRRVDGQLVLNDYEQRDADLACDELDAMVRSKEDFLDTLITLKARHPEIDFSVLAGLIEDEFTDALTQKWVDNLRELGSITHSSHIPNFSELAVKRGIKWEAL